MQPIFDLEYFTSQLVGTWDTLESALFVDSPCSAVAIEHSRSQISDEGPILPVVFTDRFLLAAGEPTRQYDTKINGLPFRPADKPWPVDYVGEPMEFLAQFNFSDSYDHIGSLPGDILLIFIRSVTLLGPPIHDSLHYLHPIGKDAFAFEWYPLNLANPANWASAPRHRCNFPTCYGVRHRMRDFYESESLLNQFASRIPKEQLPLGPSGVRDWTLRALCHTPQMKIGGVPFWFIEPDDQPEGKFIASFSGVGVTWDKPFPWVNREEPLTLEEACTWHNRLFFFDGCVINYYLIEDGSVSWYIGMM